MPLTDPTSRNIADDPIVSSAKRTLAIEAGGLERLGLALDGPLGETFGAVVRLLHGARGRVFLSGMGKSGQIARKISSTLSSTGTPSIFIHPSEASHGDLGMITPDDVIVVLSWSGETQELKDLVAYSRRFGVPLVAISSSSGSTLGSAADHVLALPVHEEACPNGLAPTTSTTMQLAIGDAMAIALLEAKGFTALDFKILHPGGKLGAALAFVKDIMHTGDQLPLAHTDTLMSDALVIMTERSFGCLGAVDGEGKLAGIITDGDLRRHMSADLLARPIHEIMTRSPIVMAPDDLASRALEVLNSASITSVFVTRDGTPLGIIHIHDLLRVGVA